MSILDEITKKDPLLLADDDHPERKDISGEKFSQAIRDMIKKYKMKDKESPSNKTAFSDGVIDSLNGQKIIE